MSIEFVARLSLALVVTFFVSAAVLAQPPFGGPPGPDGLIEDYAERLGLDDEARAAIRAIVDASHERAAGLHEDHREARRALRDLLSEDSPDEASVMRQAELLGAIETEMTKHRLRTLLRIHGQLAPEQREEMMAIHREHHGHHEMLLEGCGGDLESLCPDADSHFGHMGCLQEHADHLSEGCASTLETLRHKRRGFRRGHRGHFRH
jgi:Spy/CpxP family protein refolding chaperone